jgi:hypothetical protein
LEPVLFTTKGAHPFSKRTGSAWRYERHVCAACGRQFEPVRRAQRFCDHLCKEAFKNDQLRAARKLYALAGKPTLEELDRREDAA